MKKIAIVAHLNDLSGANKALLDLAMGLAPTFDITVIIPRKGLLSDKLEQLGIHYQVINSGTWVYKKDEKVIKKIVKILLNKIAEKKFYKYFKESQFDLIHFNSITYGCGAQSANKLGIPYTWHIRELAEENFHLTFFNRKNSFELINQSQKIVTISKFMKKKIQHDFTKDIDVVYDGIQPSLKREISKVNIENLVLIGAIADDKGQIDAIQALKILHDKGIDLDLYIVGLVTDKAYGDFIKTQIDSSVKDKIHFVGYLKDVTPYRSNNFLALVTSKAEAFGLVTIEAMDAGQFVIGARGGATPEIIDDQSSGLLYTPGNEKELANCIEEALNLSNKEDMISHGFDIIDKRFNIKNTTNKMSEIFDKVIMEAKEQ